MRVQALCLSLRDECARWTYKTLLLYPWAIGCARRRGCSALLLKPQWMNGLSERLLVSHYENNYGGAVRRLNAIRARVAALDWAHTPAFEFNGLKREELIAAGSVILHEIY